MDDSEYDSANFSTNHPLNNYISYKKLNKKKKEYLRKISISNEPHSYKEASENPNWVEAMNKEMQALLINQTWDLVPLPPNRKAI